LHACRSTLEDPLNNAFWMILKAENLNYD
jgi:hypothetical protein